MDRRVGGALQSIDGRVGDGVQAEVESAGSVVGIVESQVAVAQENRALLDGELLLSRQGELHRAMLNQPGEQAGRVCVDARRIWRSSGSDAEYADLIEVAPEMADRFGNCDEVRRIGHQSAVHEGASGDAVNRKVGGGGGCGEQRIAQGQVRSVLAGQPARQQDHRRAGFNVDCRQGERRGDVGQGHASVLAEDGVDGSSDGLFRVTGPVQESQRIADRKLAASGTVVGLEDRGAMGRDRGSNLGRGDPQGQRGRDPPPDGRAGKDVEDVTQGALGSLLEGFENKRRVHASKTAAAQAEELALVGRDLMACGIELDPGVTAHGYGSWKERPWADSSVWW